MEAVFLKILNMSITASYVIIAVVLIRLLLRKAPKKYLYLLWIVVGFRLCCPVSFQSVFSLFGLKPFDMTVAQSSGGAALQYVPDNIGMMAQPQMTVGIPVANAVISDSLPAATPISSVNPMQIWIFIGTILWCMGMVILLIYGITSYIRLHHRMNNAILLEGNVYQSDKVCSPFVLGLIHPKIFIPFGLDENTQRYVLTHERYHLKRLDHIIKPLAFLLLACHWFNPFCWLAFVLMGRDMEMSCDEKVLSSEDNIRKPYSTSLLSFASNRRFPVPSPLAFGETGIKNRIKNILNWKRPKVWVTIVVTVLCIGVVAACAANPLASVQTTEIFGQTYRVESIVYNAPQYSFAYRTETAPKYCLTSDHQLMTIGDLLQDGGTNDWQHLGKFSKVTLSKDNFDDYFARNGDGDYMWPENMSAVKLRENNQKAWQLINKNVLYYVLQQKNDDIYLAYGYKREADNESDNSSIRFLFRLALDDENRSITKSFNIDTNIDSSTTENSAANTNEDKSNTKNSHTNEDVVWSYTPILSSRYPAFPFHFNFDYTRIEATCTDGYLIGFDNHDGTAYPQGKTLTMPNSSGLYWSPDAEGENVSAIALSTKISFTAYDGDRILYSGKLIIKGTANENSVTAATYTANLSECDGLYMLQAPKKDGALLKVKGS